jgi:hypothetical protein
MVLRAMENLRLRVWELGVDSWWEGNSMQFHFLFNFGFFSFMALRAMENPKLWVWELGVDSWWEGCEPVAVFWIHRVSGPLFWAPL